MLNFLKSDMKTHSAMRVLPQISLQREIKNQEWDEETSSWKLNRMPDKRIQKLVDIQRDHKGPEFRTWSGSGPKCQKWSGIGPELGTRSGFGFGIPL